MRNSDDPTLFGRNEFLAVSWNLHKGRTPLGMQAFNAMREWRRAVRAAA
jgi:hypothetical protein